MYAPCPSCDQQHEKTRREKRPNGHTTCGNCGLRFRSRDWDAEADDKIVSELIEKARLRKARVKKMLTDDREDVALATYIRNRVRGLRIAQQQLIDHLRHRHELNHPDEENPEPFDPMSYAAVKWREEEIEMLKGELAKLPHIPNKQDKKAMRQMRAHQQRHR